jgi:hypothetical protein
MRGLGLPKALQALQGLVILMLLTKPTELPWKDDFVVFDSLP